MNRYNINKTIVTSDPLEAIETAAILYARQNGGYSAIHPDRTHNELPGWIVSDDPDEQQDIDTELIAYVIDRILESWARDQFEDQMKQEAQQLIEDQQSLAVIDSAMDRIFGR